MTFKELQTIIKNNNIPDDVHLTSDSGWECGSTEMNSIFYNKKRNEIVFTQGDFDTYYKESKEWKQLKEGLNVW